MSPELLIGPTLVAAGLLLILFRRPASRLLHRGIARWYGEPLADDWARPGAAPTRLLIAGIFIIGFGIFVLWDVFANGVRTN